MQFKFITFYNTMFLATLIILPFSSSPKTALTSNRSNNNSCFFQGSSTSNNLRSFLTELFQNILKKDLIRSRSIKTFITSLLKNILRCMLISVLIGASLELGLVIWYLQCPQS